ncbi:MAG: hypothetical protein LBJ65_03925 [Burkholderia sp.]|jgi:hypothetical protein|uniref:hypothetical protein n=1 Tax=Burkholderia sp. TaxID=36773 RepID=UPI00283051D6|nr:hypothetical protein [Burkholderia sp.]MDR0240732.1 hypothetical protein [Burkholderia sp.]
MLRTNPLASPKDTAVQPTEQHTPPPAPARTPSPQQPAHALSGLQDLSSSRARAPGATGAEKRPISPSAFSTPQASAKKSRLDADSPSPTGISHSHGTGRLFGSGADSPGPSRTEGVQAVASSHGSAAKMGGKVVDVPNLPTLQGQPDTWKPELVQQVKHDIETKLTKQHGHPVKVLGYHVTPDHNVESLRAEGFSADKHQGKAGGVAGTNIHGPGLYISERPTDDYARADGHDTMFAVVVPGTGFHKSDASPSKAWAPAQHHASPDTGHYMESMKGELKILPNAIGQVGLVPIAHIPPSMSSAALAERASMFTKPTAPDANGAPTELQKWITSAIGGHPLLKDIEAETNPENKRARIQSVVNELNNSWTKPNDATKESLLADLNARYSIPG